MEEEYVRQLVDFSKGIGDRVKEFKVKESN